MMVRVQFWLNCADLYVFLDLKFRWASFQNHCCLCDFLWFFDRAFENIFFFICPPLLYYWHGHCHIILNVLCLIPRCCFLRTSPPNYLHQNVHVECWPYFCPLCTFRRKMGHPNDCFYFKNIEAGCWSKYLQTTNTLASSFYSFINHLGVLW